MRGVRRDAPIRDRRSGAGRDLRDLLRRPGHHLHGVGHPELRLRRDGLLHRPLLLLPQHAARLVHPARRRAVHPRGRSGVGRAPLRGSVPPSAPGLTHDQSGGDDRSAGGHPVPGDTDLRRPGHSGGPRPGSAAGCRLPGLGRCGDAGPGHRLRVCARDRCRRRSDPAFHGRRPQGAGDGRLAGDDRPLGHEPELHLHRGLGRQHLVRRPGRCARCPHRRARPRQVHDPHCRVVRRRGCRSAPQSPCRGGRRAAHGYRHVPD